MISLCVFKFSPHLHVLHMTSQVVMILIDFDGVLCHFLL